MKQEIREAIDETAKALVGGNLMQAALAGANFYSVTEEMLRNYKNVEHLLADVDGYGFEPVGKSKDISVAPPKGSGVRDFSEVYDEAVKERMRSYLLTQVQFEKFVRIVKEYSRNPYFIVIRMYYFEEDAYGNELEEVRQRKMEEIAEELQEAGFDHPCSDKTLAKKKTELVRDMTVALFGEAGALSIEMYKARKAGEKQ